MELLEQSESPEVKSKDYPRPKNVDEFDWPKMNSKWELVCTKQDQYELLYNERLSCYHSNLEGTMQIDFFKNAEAGKYNNISFYNDPMISPFIMKPWCSITSIKEIQDPSDQEKINQMAAKYKQTLDVYGYAWFMAFPRTTQYTNFYHYSLDHPNQNFLARYGVNRWWSPVPWSIEPKYWRDFETIKNNIKSYSHATWAYKIKAWYERWYSDFTKFKYQNVSSIRRFEIVSRNPQWEIKKEYFAIPFYTFPKPIKAYTDKAKTTITTSNKKPTATKAIEAKPTKLESLMIKKEKSLKCYDKSTVVNTNGSTITTRVYGIPVSEWNIREFTYITSNEILPKEKVYYDQMYIDYKNSVKERNVSDQTQTIFSYFISKYPKYKIDFGIM